MGNIVDYLKSFGQKPFSEVNFKREDALCLSQLSYLKFDELLSEMSPEQVLLKDLRNYKTFDALFSDVRYEKPNRELYDAFTASRRFENLKLSFYINRIDTEDETQFSAITFTMPGAGVFVCFRGTDENMVGWQEDARLALNKPVEGQKLSARYLDDVASGIHGPFMVGGHSKGGNLAMYSSMCCHKAVRERISRIYSFDGPGFRRSFLESHNYAEIEDRVERIIPKSSYVGLMFASDSNHMVVEAKELGLAQHIPYNWVIERGRFKEGKLKKNHINMLDAFNKTVLSLDEKGAETFVNYLTDLMGSFDAATTIELSEDVMKHMLSAARAQKEVDEDTKKFMEAFLKTYFEILGDSINSEMQDRRLDFQSKLEEVFGKRKIKKLGGV